MLTNIRRLRAHLVAIVALFAAVGLFSIATPSVAEAGQVVARISLKDQRMDVTVNGWRRYTWKVSTARRGYRTPIGTYRPTRLHRRYFSKKYHNSPMPYSVFFHGGYAIHGTNAIRNLGRPASHGCVRLHPDNASKLFALVQKYGRANTRIVVTR